MSVSTTPTPVETATPVTPAETGATAAEIDASCRPPVLFFFTSAGIWLVIATLLGLVASIQLVAPQFLSGCPVLTFGRLRPVAENALLYGFASQAGYGVLIWMLCRLGRVTLCCQFPYLVAGAFWNIGVTLGVIGIFAGMSTSFKWLEFPRLAGPILFIAHMVIAVAALVSFHSRRERNVYVSQWYLVGGLFWFAWAYSAAYLLLNSVQVRGVLQGVVNAWYMNNFLMLWLGSIGLASIYYFLPKLLGRPLYSRGLAVFSFWAYAFFGTWSCFGSLVGGPFPAWMMSTSIGANLMLLLPLAGMALNWYQTINGDMATVKRTPLLNFTVASAAFFLLANLLQIILSFRSVSAVTSFTYAWGAYQTFFIFGFFALAVFAAIYYAVPRLTNIAWPSEPLIKLHFGGTAGGALLAGIGLLIAGVVQGQGINDPNVTFHDVLRSTNIWLILAALGGALIAAGQVAFLLNLVKLARTHSEPFRRSAIAFVTGNDAPIAGVKR
jgi:cytochrome c oxidase cbb3-type subunit 1